MTIRAIAAGTSHQPAREGAAVLVHLRSANVEPEGDVARDRGRGVNQWPKTFRRVQAAEIQKFHRRRVGC